MTINPKFYHYNKLLSKYASENRSNSTLAEVILWNEVLKGRKLGYQFLRQRPILNYIADFFSKELQLIIETDGVTHLEDEVKLKDKIKENNLTANNYSVLRFKDEEVVSDIDNVKTILIEWINNYEKIHPEVLKYKARKRKNNK
jgi:very-short-patch-repair endonuclease